MSRSGTEPQVYVRFRDALLDLSDAPTPVNVARYLNASKALDRTSRKDGGARRERRRRASLSAA